jgi:hypothetical protein
MSITKSDFAFKGFCTDEIMRELQNTEQLGS